MRSRSAISLMGPIGLIGLIGRREDAEPQDGRSPTGLLVFLAQLDKLAQLAELDKLDKIAELDKLGIGRTGKVYKTK